MTKISDTQQIKCYVINLDRSKDRLEYITQAFNEQGLSFERVAAVDGALLNDKELNSLSQKCVFPQKLAPAEIGCFLSHRECWHRIIESNFPWGVIFEDDIILSSNINSLLQYADWIPKGTDIVKLDTAEIICTVGRTSSIIHNNLPGPITRSRQLGRLLSKHYCTGGYILSKECAKKLFNSVEYAFAPIDEIYFNPDYGLLRKLNVQQIIPAVVIQRSDFLSTIDQQRKVNRKIKKTKKNLSVITRLSREIKRIYRRRILPSWLRLTKGYRTMKIPFE